MSYYIGIDLHKQFSSVAILDETGQLMDQQKIYHTNQQDVIDYFATYPAKTNVAVEATGNWYWLVDSLQSLGLNVKLVHAKKARIIAESTVKTDKIDARALAHLDRCNFLPQAYICDPHTRSQRELLRYYMSLVQVRTSIKNRIHAILAKYNIHHPFSDLFGKAGLKFLRELPLPEMFQWELNGYLDLLEYLFFLVAKVQIRIKKTCELSDTAKLLLTIPGFAHFSALCLSSEIADIRRFKTSKKFCCYAGLASSTHQSANTLYHGPIIKDSNKYIRYVLLEAVPKTIKKDRKLWLFHQRILQRHGRNKAKVATARKLATSIYHVLKNNTAYCLNHNSLHQVNSASELGTNA